MKEEKVNLQNEIKQQKKIQEMLLEDAQKLRDEFSERLFTLLTSAFGLVAALAWNQVIQEMVNIYVKPFFGQNSGLVTLTIYAMVITIVAVLVTYNLSKVLTKKKEEKK